VGKPRCDPGAEGAAWSRGARRLHDHRSWRGGDEVQAWIDADWSDLVRRCHVATLDASWSPFRVPVARLAPAQAVLSAYARYVPARG
jgi:hypothetical protein